MKTQQEINRIVSEFIAEKGYSHRRIAAEAGMSNSTLTTALKRGNISMKLIEDLQKAFPELETKINEKRNTENDREQFLHDQIENLKTIIKQQEYVIQTLKEIIEKNS